MERGTRAESKAVAMMEVMAAKSLRQTRNGMTLMLSAPPTFDSDAKGNKTTLVCHVRLYDKRGSEVDIDPDRRFVNPPLIHGGKEDPEQAFWEILWQSIESTPNPKAKR